MPEYPLRVFTSREALLEIRRRITLVQKRISCEDIDDVAKEGLDCSAPENYETVDRLADRLAEAHEVLRKFDSSKVEVDGLHEALALPPDLEAMVERRIGAPRMDRATDMPELSGAVADTREKVMTILSAGHGLSPSGDQLEKVDEAFTELFNTFGPEAVRAEVQDAEEKVRLELGDILAEGRGQVLRKMATEEKPKVRAVLGEVDELIQAMFERFAPERWAEELAASEAAEQAREAENYDDEAVEEMAKAMADGMTSVTWERSDDATKALWRQRARNALRAYGDLERDRRG